MMLSQTDESSRHDCDHLGDVQSIGSRGVARHDAAQFQRIPALKEVTLSATWAISAAWCALVQSAPHGA